MKLTVRGELVEPPSSALRQASQELADFVVGGAWQAGQFPTPGIAPLARNEAQGERFPRVTACVC